MKLAVQLGFVVLVACAVLVDCKPAKKASAAKKSAKAAAAPAPEPVPDDIHTYMSRPEVEKLFIKIRGGYIPTLSEILSISLKDTEAGIKTSNPGLDKAGAALAEAIKAMKSSKGKLTTEQTVKYTNRVGDAFGEATGTSKENTDKVKVCMAGESKKKGKVDKNGLHGIVLKCVNGLGDGTPAGKAKVRAVMLEYVPAKLRVAFGEEMKRVMIKFAGMMAAGQRVNMDTLRDLTDDKDLKELFASDT